MKFFIHEIGVIFLSGMFNLVPHVKFLICIHFKHVSGVIIYIIPGYETHLNGTRYLR